MKAQKLPILFFIGKLTEGTVHTKPIKLELFISPHTVYIKPAEGKRIAQYIPEQKASELTTRFLLTDSLKYARSKDTKSFFEKLTTSQFVNVVPANLAHALSLTEEMKITELFPAEKYIRMADSISLNTTTQYQLLLKREFSKPYMSIILIRFREFMQLNACPFLVKYNS